MQPTRPPAGMHDSQRYRNFSRARKIAYALLPGDAFSYVLLLRPREWPIMVAHTSLGYLLATGLDAALLRNTSLTFVATLAIWVLLLNGGTLALNSAFDADVGDIGYLDAPPPPPRHLASFSFALLVFGQAAAFLVSTRLALVYLACFALSILYSVPPFRLKAVAGADWLINIVGFGTLTPLAGWFASGAGLSSAGLLTLVGFGALFAGFYPLTQIYQIAEDRTRGDETLVIRLGVRRSLAVAMFFTGLAFALFALAVLVSSRSPIWVACLLLPMLMWGALLIRWRSRSAAGEMSDAEHKRGMYMALVSWAATDFGVLAALIA